MDKSDTIGLILTVIQTLSLMKTTVLAEILIFIFTLHWIFNKHNITEYLYVDNNYNGSCIKYNCHQ